MTTAVPTVQRFQPKKWACKGEADDATRDGSLSSSRILNSTPYLTPLHASPRAGVTARG
jgi:hypothetical protein